jgi:hypothetical protein
MDYLFQARLCQDGGADGSGRVWQGIREGTGAMPTPAARDLNSSYSCIGRRGHAPETLTLAGNTARERAG